MSSVGQLHHANCGARRHTGLVRGGRGRAALVMVAITGLAFALAPLDEWAAFLVLSSVLPLAFVLFRSKRTRDVRVLADGIHCGEALLLRRGGVRAACSLRREDTGHVVRVVDATTVVDISVPDDESARRLLGAMGARVPFLVSTFSFRRGNVIRAAGSAVLVAAASLGAGLYLGWSVKPGIALAFGLAITVVAVGIQRTRVRVAVGADGISVRDWRGRATHFYSAADAPTVVELLAAQAYVQELSLDAWRLGLDRDEEERRFQDAVAELLRARNEVLPTSTKGELPVTGPAGVLPYREACPPRGEVWRVLEDPSEDPAKRAAAATHLLSSLEPGDADRLNDVAASVVHPGLRAALRNASAPSA
jgi:hypothetical protein